MFVAQTPPGLNWPSKGDFICSSFVGVGYIHFSFYESVHGQLVSSLSSPRDLNFDPVQYCSNIPYALSSRPKFPRVSIVLVGYVL